MAASRPGQVAEPNVTPMIDVMLVLLIIFMIATPMIVQGFPVTLPRAASPDPDPEQKKDMVVGLDLDGQLYFDGQAVADDALRRYLASAFSEVPDRLLYLKADAGLQYGRVQEIIELARAAGVRTVAAVTAIQPRRSE